MTCFCLNPKPSQISQHTVCNGLVIDPEQFQAGFLSWAQAVFNVTKGQVIVVDSKQLRGSKSKKLGKKAICMVTVWATENHVALGQVKAEDKSNEIKAIPELLKLLDAVVW